MEEHYLQLASEIEVCDIRELMVQYGEDIWNYAYVLTKDAHMADDVAQETFIKAYRRFQTYRGQGTIKSWLLTIARNTAFTYMRRSFVRRVLLFDSRTAEQASKLARQAAPSAEAEAIGKETEHELWNTVLALPTKFRDPLILRYHHHLSIEEAAAVLGVSEGTVKSRIHRARQKAMKLMKGGVFHEE